MKQNAVKRLRAYREKPRCQYPRHSPQSLQGPKTAYKSGHYPHYLRPMRFLGRFLGGHLRMNSHDTP